MRIVAPSEFRSQPWKNGGGVTHEIVRWPDADAPAVIASDASDAPYAIRISIADDRAPGPFSRFPGYRRWSFLAGPAPIELDIDGVHHALVALGDHIEVPGDAPIRCALPAGPTRLFNILVREGLAISIGRGPCPLAISFAFALAPQPDLPAGHAALYDPPTTADLAHHTLWLARPRA